MKKLLFVLALASFCSLSSSCSEGDFEEIKIKDEQSSGGSSAVTIVPDTLL